MRRRRIGDVRSLALFVLAGLMVLTLSGTAVAKWWKGSHTDKWHEDKWGGDTKPPQETEIASIGFNFWAWRGDNYYPIVNVEGKNNVAAELEFVVNREVKNDEVNIRDGGTLLIGAPGAVAIIKGYLDSTSGAIPPSPSRITTSGMGILTFNPRSNNVQINAHDPVVLHLGAVDVPKMADIDGGVYHTGWVTLIGRIRALGGHEPWRILNGKLTTDRAEFLDSEAPDVLKLWFEPHTDDGEAVLDITGDVELRNTMLAVGAKGKAVLDVAAEKRLTLTKSGQLVNRFGPTHSQTVKRGEGVLVLAGTDVLHGAESYSDLEAMKVEQGLLHVKGEAFKSLKTPVLISIAKGASVAFDALNMKHAASLEFVSGAVLSMDIAGRAASAAILELAALSGDVTLDLKGLPGAARGAKIVALKADDMRGLKTPVVLMGSNADQYDALVSGNTVILVSRGEKPEPKPDPGDSPSPSPTPTPRPNPGGKSDGVGGCSGAPWGVLALILAFPFLSRRRGARSIDNVKGIKT